MIRSPTSTAFTCGSRLQLSRQRAGLSHAALAKLSGVDQGFIQAVENDTLCDLISAQEIQQAVVRFNGRGPQRVMQRTLGRWAGDFHRLADALADNFENLFPAADLAALSDQLWLKLPGSQPADNPWHDWGWYRNVVLSDDLSAETVEDELETCDLKPIISELLAGLEPREQIIIALRYGFNGAPCSRPEVGRRLGLTSNAVRRIEQRALRAAASHQRRKPSERR